MTTQPCHLTRDELVDLIHRTFRPRPGENALGVLIDLPDDQVADDEAWAERRGIACRWAMELAASEIDLAVELFAYRNVRTNNAELPERVWRLEPPSLPATADELDPARTEPLEEVLQSCPLWLAITRYSATAPLKLAAARLGFRAATLPGFLGSMTPALRLDYSEIDRRVRRIKSLLDAAAAAEIVFATGGRELRLHLDLRFRQGHASGGLLHEKGTAGNLPSGESYIVPYEGEIAGEPSRTAGLLPVELDGEVVVYRIEANRAVAVETGGARAQQEAAALRREPAYGNLAELGFGVLFDFGLRPIGATLFDEKLGLHIAFGRSDHFGGQVGPRDFNHPRGVVHIDRIYLSETQPQIRVCRVDLLPGPLARDPSAVAMMRDGRWVEGVFA